MPKTIEFLGYNPLITGQTFGQRVRLERLALGLSPKLAAQELGIDPSTLAHWEGQIQTNAKTSWIGQTLSNCVRRKVLGALQMQVKTESA